MATRLLDNTALILSKKGIKTRLIKPLSSPESHYLEVTPQTSVRIADVSTYPGKKYFMLPDELAVSVNGEVIKGNNTPEFFAAVKRTVQKHTQRSVEGLQEGQPKDVPKVSGRGSIADTNKIDTTGKTVNRRHPAANNGKPIMDRRDDTHRSDR